MTRVPINGKASFLMIAILPLELLFQQTYPLMSPQGPKPMMRLGVARGLIAFAKLAGAALASAIITGASFAGTKNVRFTPAPLSNNENY